MHTQSLACIPYTDQDFFGFTDPMYVLALWKISDREQKVLTHENFPFLSKKAEKANVTTAHAASERYVFK